MRIWSHDTCVSFKHKDQEQTFVSIIKSKSGCYSTVGVIPGHESYIYLTDECSQSIGLIVHELGHTLGRYHEHCRRDRDDYVTIHFENIIGYAWPNFLIVPDIDIHIQYDYDSVMHYDRYAYSKNGLTTIATNIPIGQRCYLSRLDVTYVNYLYNCSVSNNYTGPIFC